MSTSADDLFPGFTARRLPTTGGELFARVGGQVLQARPDPLPTEPGGIGQPQDRRYPANGMSDQEIISQGKCQQEREGSQRGQRADMALASPHQSPFQQPGGCQQQQELWLANVTPQPRVQYLRVVNT